MVYFVYVVFKILDIKIAANGAFTVSALTLLVGQQEEHPVCKKLGLGLVVTI